MSAPRPDTEAGPGTSPADAPHVDVVVPWYDDQPGLDLVLDALAAQTYPAGRLHVVVADDGSPRPPALGARPYDVRTVRQDDAGFRAAAARNLGAGVGDSPIVLFLDADTVPTPTYVERLSAPLRLPAVHPDAADLALGRRRHADLSAVPPGDALAWLARAGDADSPGAGPGAIHVADSSPAVVTYPDPAWLADGYAATDGLRAADDRSYRFVISAVLGVRRELLERIGGFDEAFVGYGGEDWDLGWRAWLAGARMRYVPDAVAWHDGPDFGGRHDDEAARRAVKNVESLRLAERITEPHARDASLVWAVPDVAVEVLPEALTGGAAGDAAGDAASLAWLASLVRGSDARVWVPAGSRPAAWPSTDARVVEGPVPDDVAARSRYRVTVRRPVWLDGVTLAALCERGSTDYGPLLVRHARDAAPRPGSDSPGTAEEGPADGGAPDPRVPRRPLPDGVRVVPPDAPPPDLEAHWGWGAAPFPRD